MQWTKYKLIADAMQKGLPSIVGFSVQQGRTRLARLRNELYIESFHAVLAWVTGRPTTIMNRPHTTAKKIYLLSKRFLNFEHNKAQLSEECKVKVAFIVTIANSNN